MGEDPQAQNQEGAEGHVDHPHHAFDQHRGDGIPGCLDGVEAEDHDFKADPAREHHPQEGDPLAGHRGIGPEQPHYRTGQKDARHGHQCAPDQAQQDGLPGDVIGPRQIPGPDVTGDGGPDADDEAHINRVDQVEDDIGDAHPGHGLRTETAHPEQIDDLTDDPQALHDNHGPGKQEQVGQDEPPPSLSPGPARGGTRR